MEQAKIQIALSANMYVTGENPGVTNNPRWNVTWG
jgi:hypothetical protein